MGGEKLIELNINEIKAVIASPKSIIPPKFLTEEETKTVRGFHKSIKGYSPTPLLSLDNLAKNLNIGNILVKDESKRFGLNAFKSLGATYAIAKVLCEKLKIPIQEANFEYFKSKDIQKKISDMIFVTATDGNHGRAVAWTAAALGCKSVVFLPKGSSNFRLKAISSEGAKASITDKNYDDTVRMARDEADKNGWILIQDTAWPGYESVPKWITQGYTTMAFEANEQLNAMWIEKPTHIFLQAGVGSMAGAVLGWYSNTYRNNYPKAIIVEPNAADCIYQSAKGSTGKAQFVKGELNTIMAGLACGEPNTITWDILRDFGFGYISCPDFIAERGMRALAYPIGNDKKIISGESGAVGIGLLYTIMGNDEFNGLREELDLDNQSIVLCFSTEGDTDPESYSSIINNV